MKSKQTVFKVHRMIDNRMVSYAGNLLPLSLITNYEIGKVTHAPIGKLFVFDTFENAKKYATSDKYIVTRGIATNVEKAQCNYMTYPTAPLEALKFFWKEYDTIWGYSHGTPVGTLFCDSYKPQEVVWKG